MPDLPFAVVTGATSGFGRAAAFHLARSRHDLALVVRDERRGAEVSQQIENQFGVAVEVVRADLSSMDDTDAAGRHLAARGRPIAVLLNNAGAVFGLRRRESVDGIELTMALNHFGYVGLTRHLTPLVGAAGGRIVNVASDAYEFAGGRFDFDDWQATRRYRPHRQYGRSKLANILFTRALARRVPAGITVTAWSPAGLTATRFAYGANPLAPLAMKLTHPFALSTETAVASLLELCTDRLPAGAHAGFFVDRQLDPVAVAPDDDAERLWGLTERMLESRIPLRGQRGENSVPSQS